VITLDTSGVLALLIRADRYHAACRDVLESDSGPYVIPVAILAEITYMIEISLGAVGLHAFLDDVRAESYALDWDILDLERIQTLTRRYEDLGFGFADAAVIACAERNRGRVLTTDRRHFPVVARGEGTIAALPVLEP
jgi:predicted nucleic acid-binding protein